MANQPKKYQKFVATAATATLVASAIVPVASAAEVNFTDIKGNTHEAAILDLAGQGIINGYEDGTFRPNASINRGGVVKLLGRWLENGGEKIPADWNTKQRFNDLPVTAEKELVQYAALTKDAEVFNGSNGNLNYALTMQRQQMAVVLVRAIKTVEGRDLVAEYKADSKFTSKIIDLDSAFATEQKEAILALEYAEITQPANGQFDPTAPVTRGQFASFLKRTIDATEVKTTEELVEAAVTAGNVLPKPENVTENNYADAQEKVDAAQKALDAAQKAVNEDKDLSKEDKEKYQKQLDNVKDAINAVQKAINEVKPGENTTGNIEYVNDTKIIVTFDKAVDKDLAEEIQKAGDRFVVFKSGDLAQKADIKSTVTTFSSDFKKATIILDKDIEADVSYKVALLDMSNAGDITVAKVLNEFGPKVLKKGAGAVSPSFSAKYDKVLLKFPAKMKEEAKDASKYEIFYNDKSIGNLSDVAEDGTWVKATDKKEVEFKLKTNDVLKAGETYKIKVADDVKTDDGDKLAKGKEVFTVTMPKATEVEPKAVFARATGDKIVVLFDKDLKDVAFNKAQITVKTPNGKSVEVTGVAQEGTNGVALEFASGEIDLDLTYTVDIPAGGARNAYFVNAFNKANSNVKATAQKNVEVTSASAKLVSTGKATADLHVTFDQRVNPAEFKETYSDGEKKISIKDGGDTYTLTQDGVDNVEFDTTDTTGKTLVFKDVNEAFMDGSDEFEPEEGTTYTVEFKSGSITTDAGSNAKTNQEKVKATFNGLSIKAPKVDKVRVLSAEEIVVEFDEDIDISALKPADVNIQGFELSSNGRFFSDVELSGGQLKLSASGSKLTIKPANSDVKFATGEITGSNTKFLTIDADTVINKKNGVTNKEISYAIDHKDVLDRAIPVIIGATQNGENGVKVTYSENVEFKAGSDAKQQAVQFDISKANQDSYGESVSVDNNVISVTFKDSDVFDGKVDFAKVQVEYTKNTNSFVQDKKQNEAKSQKITGVVKDGNSPNDGGGTVTPEVTFDLVTSNSKALNLGTGNVLVTFEKSVLPAKLKDKKELTLTNEAGKELGKLKLENINGNEVFTTTITEKDYTDAKKLTVK